jgi:O-acetyl-ADP-ribose deacetylase (regulator of RNase III)
VISYVTGDATVPRGTGPRIIAHVCNDRGSWGRGFVVALSLRWTAPEAAYRAWYQERKTNGFRLGAVQLVPVGGSIVVANMIGQHGVRLRRPPDEPPPVRYEAIGEALATLGEKALALSASVHMPRIGCGLAGGQWELVEPLIQQHLCERRISVTVYDPPGQLK